MLTDLDFTADFAGNAHPSLHGTSWRRSPDAQQKRRVRFFMTSNRYLSSRRVARAGPGAELPILRLTPGPSGHAGEHGLCRPLGIADGDSGPSDGEQGEKLPG